MLHRPLSQIQDEVVRGVTAPDEAVVELADAERDTDLAALLAPRVGLPEAAVGNVLGGEAEPPVAVLCRAAGLSANGYSAVLRMRHRRCREVSANPVALVTGYAREARLSPAELRAWLQVDEEAEN